MKSLVRFLKQQSKRLVAIVLICGFFWFTRLPALSATERATLASRFHFTRLPLPELTSSPVKSIRSVHPSLEQHSAWISSVGAAIALSDLDSDGLSNDICHVDPRTDHVIVSPVPGTGDRYAPFALAPSKLPYDSATMAPMGCLANDLNEDGQTDILVYYWGRTPVAFLQKNGLEIRDNLSPLSYVQQEIETSGERWYTNAATFADLDGDSHADLIIGNYFQDGARILDATASGQESMQHSMTRAYNGGLNHILRWAEAEAGSTPRVKFQDIKDSLDEDVSHAWTLAVGAADLDGDLHPEIYFANDFGPDRLLHNRSQPGHLAFALLEGEKGLMTPNSKVLGKDGFKGMGVDFGDVNDDGLLDIYVSNIADEYALEESHFMFTSTGNIEEMNKGIAPYVDHSEPLGVSRSSWSWETKFGDFDNDGELEALQATGFAKGTIDRWPELHELAMGNDELLSHANIWPRFQAGDDLSGQAHNPFFVRTTEGRYYDLAKSLGLDTPQVTRGIATADVDGDGDLDFAIANQWEPSYFYRNDNNLTAGTSLNLKLLLPVSGDKPTSGTPAIGATAIVHLPNGRSLVSQVDGGNGHSGARSSGLHFGLGQIQPDSTLPVGLHWRGRDSQVHQATVKLSPGSHTLVLNDDTLLTTTEQTNLAALVKENE
ncbi:CRTAC1 family protein [Leptothoe spongobia]|uniref:CRTAC1 family protein n=1 Tax=Leptothoe spongobia TAU-MAC 1115 TaxID=1967444 RepID=A0A947DDS0_9CYAN|nr:CRTAC1 family protein [Leptothoe spongobia]MBT9314704.1 CRTAC1 family protein [Leptothoe spongobia TAU-MAC 1115]